MIGNSWSVNGKMKSKLKSVLDETGTVDVSAIFSLELGGKAFMGIHEATQRDKIINQSMKYYSMMFPMTLFVENPSSPMVLFTTK